MKGVEITVESLSAARAVEKLSREGVAVLSARSPRKNVVILAVAGKDRQKAFAILRGSCYNIKNVRERGVLRLKKLLSASAGLIAGGALFFAAVCFFGTRVLRVEISGSGAYYEREVRAILKEAGVDRFSAYPSDTGALTAQILALPRVEFCAFRMEGGVLTVEIRAGEETERLTPAPLRVPSDGTVEEIVAVRGTPLVKEGDAVRAGQIAVGDYALFGETKQRVAVIAKVVVRAPVSREYAAGREEAIAQALLDFGELSELEAVATQRGFMIKGIAHFTAAIGLE